MVSVSLDGLFDADTLLRKPAAFRLSGRGLTRDGRIHSEHGIDGIFCGGCARPIRAETKRGAAIDDPLESIGAFAALIADALLHPAHIVTQMERLHLGDDVQLAESFEIVGCDNLCVHQPEPTILFAILAIQLFQIIEQQMVGFIADGMHGELESGFVSIQHVFQELAFYKVAFIIDHEFAPATAIVGIMGVRFEEACRAVAHDAVDVAFQASQSNPRIAGADLDALVRQLAPALQRIAKMNAHRQIAGFVQLAIDLQLLVIRHVADVGDAVFSNLCQRASGLLQPPFVRKRLRDFAFKKRTHAIAAKDGEPVRFPVLENLQIPCLRILGIKPDRFQSGCIGNEFAAVEFPDKHRVICGDLLHEIDIRGERFPALIAGASWRPGVVSAPVAAQNPLVSGQRLNHFPDPVDKFFLSRNLHDVELQKAGRGRKVHVIVVEAGHHKFAFEIDGLCIRIPEFDDVLIGAHRHEGSIFDGHRLGSGILCIYRPNGAIVENKIGGLFLCGTRSQG